MAIQRVNYFDHQFLLVGDFTAEQSYHLDMRRRLNRVLHGFGIAEGLDVVKNGSRQLTVKPGIAIDRHGQEIIVESDQAVDLRDMTVFPVDKDVSITIEYDDEPTTPSTAGVGGQTRITEKFVLKAQITEAAADGSVIRLAKFRMTGPGVPDGNLGGGVRQMCGAKLATGSVEESHLVPALLNRIKTLEENVTTIVNRLAALEKAALRPTFAPKEARGEFAPARDFSNKPITLYGSNFDAGGVSVFFNTTPTTPASIVPGSASPSEVKITVPVLTAGTKVTITVKTNHGSVTSHLPFTVE